ncbi:hypothetical protein D6T43_23710, partial [Salmonella enterica subsp. enterica]|nr:hypothetical protein [Salmonella enterica subsp. enterica serovar Kentucky]
FNRFNYGNDLMLSKTGFTHSDLLCWQIDYAGGSLNANGTIMRDTYNITTIYYFSPIVDLVQSHIFQLTPSELQFFYQS